MNEISKDLVKKNSEWAHIKEALASEYTKQSNLQKSIEETEEFIVKSEEEILKIKENLESLQQQTETANFELSERKRQFQAALAGAATEEDDENAKSWADQMMEAKNSLTTSKTEQKQISMKMKHLESEIPKIQIELENKGKTTSKLQQEYEKVQENLKKHEQIIQQIPFNDEIESKILNDKKNLQEEIKQLNEQQENLNARLSRLSFQYSDPFSGFDRSKVKGLLARLVHVKNPNRDSVALEVTAGGRLYNVVVDDDDTATQLIDNGKLKTRVTIIPLNKVKPSIISSENLEKAKQLAGGSNNAQIALSLIGSSKEIQKAMEYVFGSTIICPNMDIAQIIAKGVRCRCVTLDGEVYETGTLTGGSRSTSQPILRQLSQLNDIRFQLQEKQKLLDQLSSDLRFSSQYHEMKQKIQIQKHECNLLFQRLSSTESHQLQSKLQQMKLDLENSNSLMNSLKQKENDSRDKIKQLEQLESSLSSSSQQSQQDKRIKQLEKLISIAKKNANDQLNKQKAIQQQYEILSMEIKEQNDEIKNQKDQLIIIDENIKKLQISSDSLENIVADTNDKFSSLKEILDNKRIQIQKANDDIQILIHQKQDIEKKVDLSFIDIKKIEHLITKLKKDRSDAEANKKRMESKYTWIEKEKQ